MSRPKNPLCVQCAKLSREAAIALHGPEGTGERCWVSEHNRCDKRRHYYAAAPVYNEIRKQRRRQQGLAPLGLTSPLGQTTGDQTAIPPAVGESQPSPAPAPSRSHRAQAVAVPLLDVATPHAYLYYFRRAKDAPVHALMAQLWVGDHMRARACFHVTGGGAVQIKAQLLHVLEQFSVIAGVKVSYFRDEVELMPEQCPLRPCPLHPELCSLEP